MSRLSSSRRPATGRTGRVTNAAIDAPRSMQASERRCLSRVLADGLRERKSDVHVAHNAQHSQDRRELLLGEQVHLEIQVRTMVGGRIMPFCDIRTKMERKLASSDTTRVRKLNGKGSKGSIPSTIPVLSAIHAAKECDVAYRKSHAAG